MSRISFRINSIDLKSSVLEKINPNNLVKLDLTQNPNYRNDEYLLKNVSYLNKINHEFIIEDPSNKVEKLTLTLSSVLKKTTLASIFNLDNNQVKPKKQKDTAIDKYIQGNFKENNDGYVNCEYVETNHSIIGYRNIELKELKKGVDNNFRIELISRGTVKVVGYINLEIYIWDSPIQFDNQQKTFQYNHEPIFFVDPGCQITDPLC